MPVEPPRAQLHDRLQERGLSLRIPGRSLGSLSLVIDARVALASGVAGATAAVLALAGSLDVSIVLALVFVLVARAAPLAAATDPPAVAAALGRLARVVPVWAAVTAVAAVRAGSVLLADVRGANAVGGLGVARGDVLLVGACWLAFAAGIAAIVFPSARATASFGLTVSAGAASRIELFALALQAWLLVTFFAGPQVRSIHDAGPWLVGTLATAEAVWLARRVRDAEWLARAATAAALVALAAALIAGAL